ncbi:hypothetical protein F0U60_01205 [Archangium minus]|uniref:Uncharacterized protein n=1 Tax=Archangium minus TaxID=83450 RepID=A0ABY9WGM0_9BACT|nr:hypothetical protein F0U60_01205 [Archangium minus]
MTASQMFSLLSEIFSLAARLESGSIEAARRYILENFKGNTHDGLLMVLDGLEQLHGKPETSVSPGSFVEPPREKTSINASVEVLTREFKAMLLDPSFLPTKAEVLALTRRVFGDSRTARMGGKESRQELVDRAIRMFKELEEEERRHAFQYIRNMYLRGRHSSLEQWSDIITKGE